METKANYVTVGVFTLITLALAFVFVVWLGRYNEQRTYVDMDIKIEGSVTGLVKGSQVLFNGIQVGTVQSLAIAANAPRFVIAKVKIDAETPVRSDTKASIGIQGFTGGAFIQLEGGSPDASNILGLADMPEGTVPSIDAEPAALNELVAKVNSIANRTEKVMSTVESFLIENRESLSKTISNAQVFSDALAKNADGVETFLSATADIGKTIEALSAKLDGMIKGAEDVVKAIDPEAVRKTIANLEGFSQTLNASREDVSKVVDKITSAAEQLNKFSDGLNKTLGKVDVLVASVSPEKIGTAIDDLSSAATSARKIVADVEASNIKDTLENISKISEDAKKIVAAVKPERVGEIVDNIGKTVDNASTLIAAIDADRVNSALKNLDQAASRANDALAALKPDQVTRIADGIEKTISDASAFVAKIEVDKINSAFDEFGKASEETKKLVSAVDTTKLAKLIDDLGTTIEGASSVVSAIDASRIASVVDNLEKTAKGASTIVEDVSTVTAKFRNRADDINQIITDAQELASRLNKSSTKVDGILTKLDGMLGGGNGEGLMADARATLADFRKLAVNLDARIAEISKGLTRFSNRGLREAEVLIKQARQSINRIDRVIGNFERNPKAFIVGTPGIRQVSGSRPRR